MFEHSANVLLGKTVAPPIASTRFQSILPDEDDEDQIIDCPESSTNDQAENLVFWIRYQKSDGAISERDIRVVRVSRTIADNIVLSCYCYKRERPRAFRVDRILEMYWLDTGEILESPAGFFKGLCDKSPIETAVNRLRPGIDLLAFVARCDGKVTTEEVEIMADYIEWQTFAPLNRKELLTRIRAIYPSNTSLIKALNKIKLWPKNEISALNKHIRKIIDSDSLLHEREFFWASEIRETLG